jgi:hypothetical protein
MHSRQSPKDRDYANVYVKLAEYEKISYRQFCAVEIKQLNYRISITKKHQIDRKVHIIIIRTRILLFFCGAGKI